MDVLHYNEGIRRLLANIAELNNEEGPIELICGWFEELYLPGELNPELWVPMVREEGLRLWKSCFSTHEIQVLAEFHEVFKAERASLSTNEREWKKDPRWQIVSAAARRALAKLQS